MSKSGAIVAVWTMLTLLSACTASRVRVVFPTDIEWAEISHTVATQSAQPRRGSSAISDPQDATRWILLNVTDDDTGKYEMTSLLYRVHAGEAPKVLIADDGHTRLRSDAILRRDPNGGCTVHEFPVRSERIDGRTCTIGVVDITPPVQSVRMVEFQ